MNFLEYGRALVKIIAFRSIPPEPFIQPQPPKPRYKVRAWRQPNEDAPSWDVILRRAAPPPWSPPADHGAPAPWLEDLSAQRLGEPLRYKRVGRDYPIPAPLCMRCNPPCYQPQGHKERPLMPWLSSVYKWSEDS